MRRWPALGLISAMTPAALCACEAMGPDAALHDAAEPTAGEVRALDFAPLAYFNNACARCHGDYGEFYGKGYAQGYTDEALRDVVAEMVFGPAMSSLSKSELAALVAYHRALAESEPFIVITRASPDEIAGEVSPGVGVRAIMSDGGELHARVQGHAWTIRRPEALEDLLDALRYLRAIGDDGETRLNPREASHSHAQRAEGSEP